MAPADLRNHTQDMQDDQDSTIWQEPSGCLRRYVVTAKDELIHHTTGFKRFAECRVHNTLGKESSVKNSSAKNSLSSAFYRALGKVFAECPTLAYTRQSWNRKKPKKNGEKWKKMEFFN